MQPSTSINNKKHIAAFAKAATLEVKGLMARTETRYEDLSALLSENGVELSASNLRNKISGYTLSAGLFLMIVSLLSNSDNFSITVPNNQKS